MKRDINNTKLLSTTNIFLANTLQSKTNISTTIELIVNSAKDISTSQAFQKYQYT